MEALDTQNDTWAFKLGMVDKRLWMRRARRELGADAKHPEVLSRAKEMARGDYERWSRKPDEREAGRLGKHWDRLSDARKDDMAKISTEGKKTKAGELSGEEMAKTQRMAYEMGPGEGALRRMGRKLGLRSVDRYYKGAEAARRGERFSWRKMGRSAVSPFLGAGAFEYARGYAGEKARMSANEDREGTFDYESRRVNTKIKLDEGGYKYEGRDYDTGNLVGGDGTTYSMSRDGPVYRSENQWGRGRTEVSAAEADAVREWVQKNAEKSYGTQPKGDAGLSGEAMNRVFGGFGGDIDNVNYRQDNKLGAEADRAGLAGRIAGALSDKDKGNFGWRPSGTREENDAAEQRMLDYFLSVRRAQAKRGKPDEKGG